MKCNYCINEPKKAEYMANDKPVCKVCLNSVMLQKLFKQSNYNIIYISDKRVNRYNLPINRKYNIDSFEYLGGLANGGGALCQNCNKLITNIANIYDNLGNKYIVGCDCASTLSLVDTNDFWRIKEAEAEHRQLMKWVRDIKTRMDSGNKITFDYNREYKTYVIYFGHMWRYKVKEHLYSQYFKSLNITKHE